MHKITVLLFIGWVTSASAIVVQNYTAAEKAPSFSGLNLNWDYVYNYNSSSAVAVDEYWILTAKHVADAGWANSFSGDGPNYFPQQVFYHASADLALLRVDKALPGYYDLYTGYIPQFHVDPELEVLVVGYGTTGSTFSDYWTASGSTGRNTKRWGSQQIDTSDDSYKNSGTDSKAFLMYFDQGDTLYEAGAGFGDSGGGTFYKEGDTWKLAGINTGIGGGGGGFDRTYAVSIPEYADWINAVIPEPEAEGLMSLSVLGLWIVRILNRSRNRRHLKNPRTYLCDSYGGSYVVRKEEPGEAWYL